MSFAAPALAAGHRPRTGCGAAGSAINEYCDAFPTPSGPSVPRVGSPAVAKTLAPAVVYQIDAAPAATQKLLTLPAPKRVRHHRRHPRSVREASIGPASTSVWSLILTLILVLAAIALVLATIAAERWRRRRA